MPALRSVSRTTSATDEKSLSGVPTRQISPAEDVTPIQGEASEEEEMRV